MLYNVRKLADIALHPEIVILVRYGYCGHNHSLPLSLYCLCEVLPLFFFLGTTTHHHFLSLFLFIIVFVRFFHCFSSLLSLPFFFLFFYLSPFFFLSLSGFCFLCLIILSSYFLDLSIAFSLVKLSPTAMMCHHLNYVTGCAFNQSCKQIIQWYRGRLKQTFEDKQTVAADK